MAAPSILAQPSAIAGIGAHAPDGVAALERALVDVGERFGGSGMERTVPVVCASFGRTSGVATKMPYFYIPFDAQLAPGGPLPSALPVLRTRTRKALVQRWLPAIREISRSR